MAHPTILTQSGNHFNFLTPDTSEFGVEDIAHALSHECRFAGHSRHFYSVAEHSLMVSHIVPQQHALQGLLHDAAEAFVKDIPKPLKRLLPDYAVIEKRVEAAIFTRFGLPPKLSLEVKHADLVMLATEQRDLMAPHVRLDRRPAGVEPLAQRICPMTPRVAKLMFLHRYHELTSTPKS